MNGILNAGNVKAGDPVYLGPDSNGNWMSTAIKSIQRKRFVQKSLNCALITHTKAYV